MRFSFIFSLGFLVSNCTFNLPMKPVNLDLVFHDNGSKAWMINRVWNKQGRLSKPKKTMVLFVENGKCVIHERESDCNTNVKRLSYDLSVKNELSVYNFNTEWKYRIISLDDNLIKLEPILGGDSLFTLELIPLNESFF